MLGDVVRVDAHYRNAAGQVIAAQSRQLVGDVDDERAVVAHEHDQQRRGVGEIVAADLATVDVHEPEIGRLGPQGQHRARGANHRFTFRVHSTAGRGASYVEVFHAAGPKGKRPAEAVR